MPQMCPDQTLMSSFPRQTHQEVEQVEQVEQVKEVKQVELPSPCLTSKRSHLETAGTTEV